MARRSVVVVGGGVAGLAAAYELSEARASPDPTTPRIELIELSERLGGPLATIEFAGRVLDVGPDGVLARRPEALELIDELGLRDRLEPIAASGAWIWLREAARELPPGLTLGVPTDAAALRRWKGLSRRARWALARDRRWPARLSVGEDATVGEIVRAKLGDEIARALVEPLIGGIQAGRIDELSARSVFPDLFEAARRGGSLVAALGEGGPASPGPHHATVSGGPAFVSLTTGIGSLVGALEGALVARGVVLRRATAVTALRRTPSGPYPWEVDTATTTTPVDAVVLATPAPVTAALGGRHAPALAGLSRVRSAGVAVVSLSLERATTTLPATGTGLLVPLATAWPGPDTMLVTALTFLDRKWPHLRRDDDVLVRAHVGRSDDARWRDLDDDALVARVVDEARHLLGRVGVVRAAHVARWPAALAQYEIGHASLVEAARTGAHALGLALAGSAYDGVGVPATIGSGRRAAREVRVHLAHQR
ncbi:MAG: protoporphyrinogen oxidase [Acidimicrobiales bacterium]